MVPLRDQCWEPRAPQSTRVGVSRDDAGCASTCGAPYIALTARSTACVTQTPLAESADSISRHLFNGLVDSYLYHSG
jgi:hypothetical protein